MHAEDILQAARKKVDEVSDAVRKQPYWHTQQGKPFTARVTPAGFEIVPKAGSTGASIPIRRDQLAEGYANVIALERARETVRIGDFTPSFWHSYAAALYYGWSGHGTQGPEGLSGPTASPPPVASPPPAESRRSAVTIREALVRAMAKLTVRRPIFHNESDFQHALAQTLLHYGFEEPRLERRMPFKTSAYLDVYSTWFGTRVGIELKYKTRALAWQSDDQEPFSLRNQSAVDVARYDFLSDIQRLEYAIGEGFIDLGFAVMLTNDIGYWTDARTKQNTADEFFRIHEGNELSGMLPWGASAGAGTKKGREAPIQLAGKYACRWTDYGTLTGTQATLFRYLALQISASGTVPPKPEGPSGEDADPPPP